MFKLSVELLPIGGICVINVNLNVTEYFEELGGLCQKCEKKNENEVLDINLMS